jgi:hypothetical protein
MANSLSFNRNNSNDYFDRHRFSIGKKLRRGIDMTTEDLSFDDDQTFPENLRLNEMGEVPELTDLFEDHAFPEEETKPVEDIFPADDDFANI